MTDEIPFDPDLDGDAEGYLLALTRLTAGSDPAAALTIFRYLRDQLSAGEPLDPAVLDNYLLPALDRIIESKSPSNEVAKAFGFKAEGRGQYKRHDTLERDWLMAIHTEIRYREIKQEKNRLGSQESPKARAFIDVGEQFGIKESVVRDAYLKYRNGGEDYPLFNPFAESDASGVLKVKGLSEMSVEELYRLLGAL